MFMNKVALPKLIFTIVTSILAIVMLVSSGLLLVNFTLPKLLCSLVLLLMSAGFGYINYSDYVEIFKK